MKVSKEYHYVILCEDKQMQTFVTHFLRDQDVERHHIRTIPMPGSKGSGEQFVRDHLDAELKELRRRSYNRNALIVLTDADNLSVEGRIQALQKEVSEYAISKMNDVLLWIPKRHIETWIYYLRDEKNVDEETRYDHHVMLKCKEESKKLSKMFQDEESEYEYLPSLLRAKEAYQTFCKNQR